MLVDWSRVNQRWRIMDDLGGISIGEVDAEEVDLSEFSISLKKIGNHGLLFVDVDAHKFLSSLREDAVTRRDEVRKV